MQETNAENTASVRLLADATLVEVHGSLDVHTSRALQTAIEVAETEASWRIIVSLEDCTYCDSTGVSVLVRAKKRINNRFMVVLPVEHPVRHVFRITQLDDYLEPFADVQAARNFAQRLPVAEPQ